MKTEITELLGIEYPVIRGGMAWVAVLSSWQQPYPCGGERYDHVKLLQKIIRYRS